MSEDDRARCQELYEPRDRCAKVINGTREHHQHTPQPDGSLYVYRVSGESFHITHKTSLSVETEPQAHVSTVVDTSLLRPGQHVGCLFDENWYVGCVTSVGDFDSVEVSFLEVGEMPLSYKFPRKLDVCEVPRGDVLGTLELTTTNHRSYFAHADDLNRMHSLYLKK